MNQAPKVAYIGLGSNLGDRAQNIQNAIEALQEKHVHVAATSQLYETNPVDVCEQQRHSHTNLANPSSTF